MNVFAVINDNGDYCVGHWETVISYVFTITDIYTDNPTIEAKGYKTEAFHSYNKDEYTEGEAYWDACKELFYRLKGNHYPNWKIFKQL